MRSTGAGFFYSVQIGTIIKGKIPLTNRLSLSFGVEVLSRGNLNNWELNGKKLEETDNTNYNARVGIGGNNMFTSLSYDL